MRLTLTHLFSAGRGRKKEWIGEENYFSEVNRTFTVQYPSEEIPVPDHGRYQLDNEIDDCIVCDKCARICPVDCIEIEPVRAPETFGHASDGTPIRIHAAKFDIDMAKCCFCGLCTVVCPTECLTMTKHYDYSTTDILDHIFSFSKMTEQEITEKKKEFEEFRVKKPVVDTTKSEVKEPASQKAPKPKVVGTKSVFKPKPMPRKK